MTDYAIHYEASAYSFREKVMGRQSAGAAFMQAVADSRPGHITCYARNKAGAENCAQTLASLGASRTGVNFVPFDQPQRLAEAGVLYRPDPAIGPQAWHRLTRSQPRAYSLCGITHTISSHGPMTAFAEYLTAPLESWDAVICTSRVARDAVRHVLERQADHLRARVGATRFTLPQLPVIPLGVHTRQFVVSSDARVAARARLGLADDEVAFLFAGRLVVHGKAHPLPMYLALEQAAKGRKVVLIQAGQAPSPEILTMFTEEPTRFCPSVRVVMVDGGDTELYRAAWAAADVFTSLSDSFQETFGLTPLEAMASGLPVVVSDWNGYKDTVRPEIDGFRIPTLTLPPGRGSELADRHDLNVDNFDYYCAYAGQLVAVDVEATAQAYRRLIDEPELRARMGAAGAKRARDDFDWAVIFRRYLALWDELAERRRADPQLTPPLPPTRRPDRADPFSMFASYPTHHVGAGTFFRRRAGVSVAEAVSRRDLASTEFGKPIMPTPALITALLDTLASDWAPFDDLARAAPGTAPEAVASALVWLSKVGVMDFRG